VHTQLGGVAGLARDGATTIGCTTVRAHAEHAQMRGAACSHNSELGAEWRTTGQEPSGMTMVICDGTSRVGPEPPTLGYNGGSGKASAAPRELAGQEPRRTWLPAEAMRSPDGLAPFTFPIQNGTSRPGQGLAARDGDVRSVLRRRWLLSRCSSEWSEVLWIRQQSEVQGPLRRRPDPRRAAQLGRPVPRSRATDAGRLRGDAFGVGPVDA
jgi:hypothetical protein